MTRTPKPAAVTPAAATAAPAAAVGTEAGTTAVKTNSRFKRNAALIGGGAAVGAGGMAYRNQTMSKSAFGVTHEVTKAERVAGKNDRWVFSDGEYNARRDQMKRNKGLYAGAGALGAASLGSTAYAFKNANKTKSKRAAMAAIPTALATSGLVHYADIKEAKAANKWRESQGLKRRNPVTGLARVSKSAFGVDHEVSKVALPKVAAPKMAGLGNKVGQAANAGLTKFPKMNAGVTGKLRQVSAAASRNPTQMGQRTAVGLGVAGAGAAGAYGVNRNKRY
jgi:hypothetical protein